MTQLLETNLEAISAIALQKVDENDRFRTFLQTINNQGLDQAVHELNDKIAPKIDCTQCGNCCKSLMVLIDNQEADALSTHLHQTRASFDAQHLEKGSNGLMIMNTMPCHFLQNNKCSVYEYRFAGCKEFPAMHMPHFRRRLFTTFMHYDRCPIIFNVVEELKKELPFV
jgi:Fe-S-cluster containining protein